MNSINEKKIPSNTEEYINYCQEMRLFLLKRVKIHLAYLTIMYVAILPILFVIVKWAYLDNSISITEVSLIGILAANLYLIVRFHTTRYSASIIERTKWHRYYESMLRVRALTEMKYEKLKITDDLIIKSSEGLFPEFEESRKLSLNRFYQNPISKQIKNSNNV